MANPYQYQQPATEPRRFAGRTEALAFIQTHLAGGAQANALVILGPPQIGKTSLLRMLPYHLDPHYIPIRLALRAGTVAGEAAWLNALAATIPEALTELKIQSARLPELPGEIPELREALRGEYLAAGLHDLRRDRHLLLLVDNAERLLTAVQQRTLPRDTFAFLAELLAAHDHFDLILSFDARHEPALLSLGPPIDPALIYRLGALTHGEMDALLQIPAEEGGLDFQPAALEALYELTAGHPYLAQLMGWLLAERQSEQETQGAPVTPEDVQAVTAAALVMAGDTLGAVWQHGSRHDQLVLTALSALSPDEPPEPVPHEDIGAWLIAADRELDPRTVNATWRRLEYDGVLTLHGDGRLMIQGGLQRRWLREHITLPEGGGQRTRWQRLGMILAATLVVLALLMALLSSLANGGPGASDSAATITLNLDLQATGEAYDATQTAAP